MYQCPHSTKEGLIFMFYLQVISDAIWASENLVLEVLQSQFKCSVHLNFYALTRPYVASLVSK